MSTPEAPRREPDRRVDSAVLGRRELARRIGRYVDRLILAERPGATRINTQDPAREQLRREQIGIIADIIGTPEDTFATLGQASAALFDAHQQDPLLAERVDTTYTQPRDAGRREAAHTLLRALDITPPPTLPAATYVDSETGAAQSALNQVTRPQASSDASSTAERLTTRAPIDTSSSDGTMAEPAQMATAIVDTDSATRHDIAETIVIQAFVPGMDLRTALILAEIILTTDEQSVTVPALMAELPQIAERVAQTQAVLDSIREAEYPAPEDGSGLTPEQKIEADSLIIDFAGTIFDTDVDPNHPEEAAARIVTRIITAPEDVYDHLTLHDISIEDPLINELLTIAEVPILTEQQPSAVQTPATIENTQTDGQEIESQAVVPTPTELGAETGVQIPKKATLPAKMDLTEPTTVPPGKEVAVVPSGEVAPHNEELGVVESEIVPPYFIPRPFPSKTINGVATDTTMIYGPVMGRDGEVDREGAVKIEYHRRTRLAMVTHPYIGDQPLAFENVLVETDPQWNYFNIIKVTVEQIDGKNILVQGLVDRFYIESGSLVSARLVEHLNTLNPTLTIDRPTQSLGLLVEGVIHPRSGEVAVTEGTAPPFDFRAALPSGGQRVEPRALEPWTSPQYKERRVWGTLREDWFGFDPVAGVHDDPSFLEDVGRRWQVSQRERDLIHGITDGTIPSAEHDGWNMPGPDTNWQLPESVAKLLVVPNHPGARRRANRVVLGDIGRETIAAPLGVSVIETGPPGIGKTNHLKKSFEAWVMAGGFGVWFSTKAELDLVDVAAQNGPVYIYAPFGLSPGSDNAELMEKYGKHLIRINPLDGCDTLEGAMFTAKAHTNDAIGKSDDVFFNTQAERTLASMYHLGALAGLTMDDMRYIGSKLGFQDGVSGAKISEGQAILTQIYKELITTIPAHQKASLEQAYDNLISLFGKSEKQRSSIAGMVEVVLNDMTHPSLLKASEVTDIRPEDMVGKRGALFMIGDTNDQDKFGRVYAHIWNRMTREIRRQSARGSDDRPVPPEIYSLFVADELARLAELDNFMDDLQEGRGYGIVIQAGIQSIESVKPKYPALVKSLNSVVVVAHTGTDAEVIAEMSALAGNHQYLGPSVIPDERDTTWLHLRNLSAEGRRETRQDRKRGRDRVEKEKPRLTASHTGSLIPEEQAVVLVQAGGVRLLHVQIEPYYLDKHAQKLRARAENRRNLELRRLPQIIYPQTRLEIEASRLVTELNSAVDQDEIDSRDGSNARTLSGPQRLELEEHELDE